MSVRAVAAPRAPILLAASAVAVSHTGNTNETTLATVTIPAGAMGLNGGVHIYTSWTTTNSANNKVLRARFGGGAGTTYLNDVVTTSVAVSDFRRIRNRNSASSQIGSSPATSGAYTIGVATAHTTSSVDTSAAVDILLTAQLALGTETITLENYEVWLVP